jgi:hypothetical protein
MVLPVAGFGDDAGPPNAVFAADAFATAAWA